MTGAQEWLSTQEYADLHAGIDMVYACSPDRSRSR